MHIDPDLITPANYRLLSSPLCFNTSVFQPRAISIAPTGIVDHLEMMSEDLCIRTCVKSIKAQSVSCHEKEDPSQQPFMDAYNRNVTRLREQQDFASYIECLYPPPNLPTVGVHPHWISYMDPALTNCSRRTPSRSSSVGDARYLLTKPFGTQQRRSWERYLSCSSRPVLSPEPSESRRLFSRNVSRPPGIEWRSPLQLIYEGTSFGGSAYAVDGSDSESDISSLGSLPGEHDTWSFLWQNEDCVYPDQRTKKLETDDNGFHVGEVCQVDHSISQNESFSKCSPRQLPQSLHQEHQGIRGDAENESKANSQCHKALADRVTTPPTPLPVELLTFISDFLNSRIEHPNTPYSDNICCQDPQPYVSKSFVSFDNSPVKPGSQWARGAFDVGYNKDCSRDNCQLTFGCSSKERRSAEREYSLPIASESLLIPGRS